MWDNATRMRRLCVPLVIVLAFVGAGAPSGAAAAPPTQLVGVELVSESESIRPGETFTRAYGCTVKYA